MICLRTKSSRFFFREYWRFPWYIYIFTFKMLDFKHVYCTSTKRSPAKDYHRLYWYFSHTDFSRNILGKMERNVDEMCVCQKAHQLLKKKKKNKSLLYLQQKTSFWLLKWNRYILKSFFSAAFWEAQTQAFKQHYKNFWYEVLKYSFWVYCLKWAMRSQPINWSMFLSNEISCVRNPVLPLGQDIHSVINHNITQPFWCLPPSFKQ